MGGDAAGEGELLEKLSHAVLVPGYVGVDLGVAAVQPVLSHHGVAAVAGAGEIDHVQVAVADDAVQMGIDKVLPGHGAPVADNLLLDLLALQRLLQQGIVQQVELCASQIVRRAPPQVHFAYLFVCCSEFGHTLTSK
jgi:hypothetical protein